MKKKTQAVQATATAVIARDPVREFLDLLPKNVPVLGMKGHRTAEKSEIYVCYHYDGNDICASLSWEGGVL